VTGENLRIKRIESIDGNHVRKKPRGYGAIAP
jgi:hypothetical protein